MTNTLIGKAAATEAIVRSAAAGDELAFARLVAEHHRSMARVAFVVCGDADMTVDAVQSAWAIAWQRIGTLRDPSQVRAWLVAVAACSCRLPADSRSRSSFLPRSSRSSSGPSLPGNHSVAIPRTSCWSVATLVEAGLRSEPDTLVRFDLPRASGVPEGWFEVLPILPHGEVVCNCG